MLLTYVLKFALVRGTVRSIFESAASISAEETNQKQVPIYSCDIAQPLAEDCLREILASANNSPSYPSSPRLVSNVSFKPAEAYLPHR